MAIDSTDTKYYELSAFCKWRGIPVSRVHWLWRNQLLGKGPSGATIRRGEEGLLVAPEDLVVPELLDCAGFARQCGVSVYTVIAWQRRALIMPGPAELLPRKVEGRWYFPPDCVAPEPFARGRPRKRVGVL